MCHHSFIFSLHILQNYKLFPTVITVLIISDSKRMHMAAQDVNLQNPAPINPPPMLQIPPSFLHFVAIRMHMRVHDHLI